MLFDANESNRARSEGSYPVVLIGGDSHEASLREGKRAEVPVCIHLTVGSWIHVHHVEAWLVAVH